MNEEVETVMWSANQNPWEVDGLLAQTDERAALSAVRAPVLFTAGASDMVLPSTIEMYAKLCGGYDYGRVQVSIFENSRHLPHLEEPAQYLHVLESFLTAAERPPAFWPPLVGHVAQHARAGAERIELTEWLGGFLRASSPIAREAWLDSTGDGPDCEQYHQALLRISHQGNWVGHVQRCGARWVYIDPPIPEDLPKGAAFQVAQAANPPSRIPELQAAREKAQRESGAPAVGRPMPFPLAPHEAAVPTVAMFEMDLDLRRMLQAPPAPFLALAGPRDGLVG